MEESVYVHVYIYICMYMHVNVCLTPAALSRALLDGGAKCRGVPMPLGVPTKATIEAVIITKEL